MSQIYSRGDGGDSYLMRGGGGEKIMQGVEQGVRMWCGCGKV